MRAGIVGKDDDIGFVDSVAPEVADNYRRLNADTRLDPVFEKLKGRGLSDRDVEILLRRIAQLPEDWERENEGWNERVKRRAAMAKKLRKLAEQVAVDPDLKELRLKVDAIAYCYTSEGQDEFLSFADALNIGVSFVESSDLPLIMGEDGNTLTPEEHDKLHSPVRKISEQSYVLLAIFELLDPYYQPAPNALPPRAPNKEIEALGAALLQRNIKSGTVSKLRPDDRRKYTLEPK